MGSRLHMRLRAVVGLALAFACAAVGVALAATGGGSSHGVAAGSAPTAVIVPAPGAGASPGEGGGETGLGEGPSGRALLSRWVMREDAADRGRALGWAGGHFAGAAVTVPNTIRAGAFTGRAGEANNQGSVAWYRTSFRTTVAGPYEIAFASASFEASAWVDGRALLSHRGPYLPFAHTASLAPGTHTLVVRIDWRNPNRYTQEGFHRTWFNWGGLDGRVTVRAIGASDVTEPQLQTVLSGASARVTVSARVTNEGPARLVAPTGSLTRGADAIALAFPPAQLGAGASKVLTATATVASPALWSPSSPALYALRLAVPGESAFTAHVGLRQITWQGGTLRLNGRRVLLHGASVQTDALGHGDALTGADKDAIVRELRSIHADAVRSQHPLDAGMLERLDAAGILVWQGLGPVEGAGNWAPTTPALLAGAERQAETAALAERLHPSVFAWNVVNEIAENGSNASEVRYVQDLAARLHATDPGRMVAVDVWGTHAPQSAGAIYSHVDAVAETDYSGWYENPRASTAAQVAEVRSRLAAMRRTFPGKVLVISEFGAESNALNPAGSPGSYDYQSRLLAAHIAAYRAEGRISAMLIWLLRDYPLTPSFTGGSIREKLPSLRFIEGINGKGLFTYSGAPKPAAATVAHLYSAIPAG